MINVNNLRLQFGGRVLFEDVNLKFDGGNCYGIIGANGAGKSTFLKLITKQIEPSSGDVVIERGKRLSVLSQDQKAWDDYTVLSTVMHGYERLMEIMREKDELYAKADFTDADGIRAGELENEFMEIGGWEAESEAQNLLNELGISEYSNKYPRELSGGERQRVAIARAVVKNPKIILADEPCGNLDSKMSADIMELLQRLNKEYGKTVVMVTHNEEQARQTDRIIRFFDGRQVV